jgi:hypothetical protein
MARLRITPALIVSVIALILAVAGTAAAGGYIITKTSQIKPSVRRALKGNRGPRGFTGPAGAPGAQGAPGTTGVASIVTVDGNPAPMCASGGGGCQVASSTATCPPSYRTVGGGQPRCQRGTQCVGRPRCRPDLHGRRVRQGWPDHLRGDRDRRRPEAQMACAVMFPGLVRASNPRSSSSPSNATGGRTGVAYRTRPTCNGAYRGPRATPRPTVTPLRAGPDVCALSRRGRWRTYGTPGAAAPAHGASLAFGGPAGSNSRWSQALVRCDSDRRRDRAAAYASMR